MSDEYGNYADGSKPEDRVEEKDAPAPKKEKKVDWYVHLANGEVRELTNKELLKSREASGTQHAFRDNGVEHTVIGVYPREVEFKDATEEDE